MLCIGEVEGRFCLEGKKREREHKDKATANVWRETQRLYSPFLLLLLPLYEDVKITYLGTSFRFTYVSDTMCR